MGIRKSRVSELWVLLMIVSTHSHADSKTATLGVSATLVSSCVAGTSNAGVTSFGTLNFGTVYFLSKAVTVTGQQNAGAIQIKCNNGTAWRVLLGGGQSGNTSARYLSGGPTSQHINYNLYTSAAYNTIWDNQTGISGTGSGQTVWLPVYGLVAQQATPSAGNYSDTVQVTVSW
nr:spore coat U domain-containing protein [Edaphovirga cremea]